MAFTALATKVYKDPVTVQWANSIKGNDDYLLTAASKCWISFDGSGVASSNASFGIASVSRISNGEYSVVFSTPFASALSYAPFVCANRNSTDASDVGIKTQATGSCTFVTANPAGTQNDCTTVYFQALGLQ